MGTDKAFLEVRGETLLARQLRCLHEAGGAELLISGRPDADYSHFDAGVIYDLEPDAGPLGGLAAVLDSAHHDIVLCLAVDMPAMTPAMLRKILASATYAVGCVPFDEDSFQPLAAIYPKTVLPLIKRQLEEHELSMHSLVRRAIGGGLVRPLQLSPFEKRYFLNWNCPSDWAAFDGGENQQI
jgi:molybdenum cofactor guanylyltransferase